MSRPAHSAGASLACLDFDGLDELGRFGFDDIPLEASLGQEECFEYLLNTASRSAGFVSRRPAFHRSPTSLNRAGAVRMVKSRGSIARSTSFQVSGVETPA